MGAGGSGYRGGLVDAEAGIVSREIFVSEDGAC
jgi:hypothetical protein